ncbi:Pls/PosA family non-ribosomal peptide synthetase [Arthrobacter sp. V1I9]|uniref:Pls/PosA family non-ribosomal peptide synthetase n=1 Tax=Arthrobacter sp. V1I9 TaxID=3042275 RepID=UPI0027D84A83|nr:Pls/PosA family non-ribosomal peptide synthetase [Arthrobacter sp. V1I9]
MSPPVPEATAASAGDGPPATPATGADVVLERRLADLLASVVKKDDVPVDANFFYELGADSLVMAQFCARVRKQPDLPAVSIKDIYQNPTIGALAAALAPTETTAPAAELMSASVQIRLAELLAGVLGREQVSTDANFFNDLGADSLVMAQFCARVRKQPDLPPVSIKDIYQNPTIGALAAALAPTETPAPAAESMSASVQIRLAELLAGVLGREQVSTDANFFNDLGADSLVMAQFCARVRKHPDLPPVSIKDIYRTPTISALALALAPADPAPSSPPAVAGTPTSRRALPEASPDPAPEATSANNAGQGRHGAVPAVVTPATTTEYLTCGMLQVLIFLAYTYLYAVIFEKGLEWVWAGNTLPDHYVRGAGFGAVTFVTMCTLPILVKWVLIGRWRPQEIRIWSLAYVRFWFVKTAVMANPLVLFAGSPLYLLYLRALGAKVGKGAVVFTRHMPVCTDMLTIGEHTVIDKETFLSGYRAINGVIQTGPVSIGGNVLIGEKAVLDIRTSLGDGAQLGHASSLHEGQSVPAGESWNGSPARLTSTDYRMVPPAPCGTWRRARFAVLQLANRLLITVPVAFTFLSVVIVEVPWTRELLDTPHLSLASWSFLGVVLGLSLALFLGAMIVSLIFVMTVPRLLNLALKPDRVYPLYGIHYVLHRAIGRITNRKFFHELFGDSSFIVHYLLSLGYKLSPVVQTGSNFGTEVKHDNPYLSAVGRGTVVAAGLSFINANYSSTAFSVSRSAIGANSFLGNDIVYPPQGKVGDNCLIATKALVPIDGEIREGIGLLGSPAFEIPRTVQRDSAFIRMAHDDEFPRRLAAKNRHNLVSMALFLLSRWFYTFVVLLASLTSVDLIQQFGAFAIMGLPVVMLVFTVLYFAFVERASTGFHGVRPKHCSIYDIDFWRTERFFKLCARANVHRLLSGTPFKGPTWRLVGVRVGKRLFDDGAGMSEKNIVTLGDNVILNAGSYIQCHSQEDYAFKSDATVIGSGCTLGVATMVHYGVTMGDGVVLAPDSFLMKGGEVPAFERWGGNPAEVLSASTSGLPALPIGTASPASSGGAAGAVATY